LTQDCPVGWSRIKQRAKATMTAAASLVIALLTGVLFVNLFSKGRAGVTVGELKIPFTTPTPVPLMGAIAYRPTEPKQDPEPSIEVKGKVSPQKPVTKFEVGRMKVIQAAGADIN
jgi:hypothetical protein